MRVCSCCYQIKPLTKYAKNRSIPGDGIRKQCNDCRNTNRRKRYRLDHERIRKQKRNYVALHKEKQKEYMLLRNYGITYKEYLIKLSSQNNVCAICYEPEISFCSKSQKIKSLAVDHNHKTGKIRGLLCTKCNSALGKLRESPIIITNMLKYITKYLEK